MVGEERGQADDQNQEERDPRSYADVERIGQEGQVEEDIEEQDRYQKEQQRGEEGLPAIAQFDQVHLNGHQWHGGEISLSESESKPVLGHQGKV